MHCTALHYLLMHYNTAPHSVSRPDGLRGNRTAGQWNIGSMAIVIAIRPMAIGSIRLDPLDPWPLDSWQAAAPLAFLLLWPFAQNVELLLQFTCFGRKSSQCQSFDKRKVWCFIECNDQWSLTNPPYGQVPSPGSSPCVQDRVRSSDPPPDRVEDKYIVPE
jgi:hypothetical protein